jgi:predicted RNA-binding Zn ribbon-like protein
MPVSTPIPHDLELVIDFVNTLDIDQGTEALDSPASLDTWLAGRGLADRKLGSGAAELQRAVELREALRAVLLAHTEGGAVPAGAAATLDDVAARGELTVTFAADAGELVVRCDGLDGALARLLLPVVQSVADGTWPRAKACVAEDCRWAFYDTSRNRSGHWCDMAVCGNRAKVRAYRERQR